MSDWRWRRGAVVGRRAYTRSRAETEVLAESSARAELLCWGFSVKKACMPRPISAGMILEVQLGRRSLTPVGPHCCSHVFCAHGRESRVARPALLAEAPCCPRILGSTAFQLWQASYTDRGMYICTCSSYLLCFQQYCCCYCPPLSTGNPSLNSAFSLFSTFNVSHNQLLTTASVHHHTHASLARNLRLQCASCLLQRCGS